MTDEPLISKKEVLEELGISYGQLYRWKRKGLIPEAWFIRQSTFTGQETFFPREKIIGRIQRIKEMKENVPLDDLAELITTRVNEKLEVAFSRLRNLGWLNDQIVEACHLQTDRDTERNTVPVSEALCVGVLCRLEKAATKEEMDLAKKTLDRATSAGLVDQIRTEKLNFYLLRKRLAAAGISAQISLAVIAHEGARFDPEIEIAQTVDLQGLLETIRFDLVNGSGVSPDANHDHPKEGSES
jgi:DNA-binding transcriptional MerR regulator